MDFKIGDKVLLRLYSGAVTGTFVIVEFLEGKLFCKIQLVNAVYYEGNELLVFEWRKNLMPLNEIN